MKREDAIGARKLIMDFLEDFLSTFLSQLRRPEYHLDSIVWALEECHIEYCILGGLAVQLHNYVRYTDDVDILVSKNTYPKIAEYFIGHGYELRPGSNRNLYLTLNTVRMPIDIFVEGDVLAGHPLPDPTGVRVRCLSKWWTTLPCLVTSKLRAGGGNHRRDVLLLIENNELTEDFATKLEPDVKDRFLDILHS